MAETGSALKRKKIGLLLTGDYSWAGGLYYVLNIIKALDYLDDVDKPELVIFYNQFTPKEILSEIKYPYHKKVQLRNPTLFFRFLNRIFRIFFNSNIYLKLLINPYHLDFLYPISEFHPDMKLNCKIVNWIYDLQHKYLPEYFSKTEIDRREQNFNNINKHASHIVVSSYDTLHRVKAFYPDSHAKFYVLQFVSIINRSQVADIDEVKKKYHIERPYFIVANQFWQHKNHLVVFKALAELKKSHPDILVVCTGTKTDHRNKKYFDLISSYISSESLHNNILFTGFIPREEQAALIKNSIAIIQPSKFEGWGTVVEDAKTLNKPVILSNINVHHEQIAGSNMFFSPDDSVKLAQLISEAIKNPKLFVQEFDMEKKAKEFAHNFLKLAEEIAPAD
jgi:glycosyltransferase involved in cell wall biosynthesis